MTAETTRISGEYFAPRSSKSHQGSLTLADGRLFVADATGGCLADNLRIDTVQGTACLYFSDGSYFKSAIPIPPILSKAHLNTIQKNIVWLEKFSFKKAIILSLLLLVSVVLYRVTFFALSETLTLAFPQRWEAFIGEQSYETLRPLAFDPTALPAKRIRYLHDRANDMATRANLQYRPQILFHQSDLFGANAFAFPGGPIVVTDGLVKLLKDNEQILAVIAHEYGHIESRHSLKQLIDLTGASLLAYFLFGAYDSINEEIIAAGVNFWAIKNSRDYEKEADISGTHILKASGLKPRNLMLALEKLTGYYCKAPTEEECLAEDDKNNWLSTHPSGKERLRYLGEITRNLNNE